MTNDLDNAANAFNAGHQNEAFFALVEVVRQQQRAIDKLVATQPQREARIEHGGVTGDEQM